MKKIYTIVILLSMGITQIYAQSCFQCTGTTASGDKASSIGYGTTASGLASFAGGNTSEALGNYSFAFGNNAKAMNTSAIALGSNAVANFADGIAIGSNLISDASNSYLFGQNLWSNGSNSLTLGIGSSSSSPLANSKDNSIMFGVTNKPSLTILKPTNGDVGYIGIGTDNPKEMAHVVGTLLIDRSGEIASSLQFRHPNKKGNIKDPQDSVISGTSPFYWDIYSDVQGLKINTILRNTTVTQRMMIAVEGVGIGEGITTPKAKLHVDNTILAEGNITTLQKIVLAQDYSSSDYWEIARSNAGLKYSYHNNGRYQDALSISTNGLLCAKEVRVSISGSPCWPDFVFSKNYNLLPLAEVEQFITENQHLPNVPSAAEVEANGIELGEMNAILLQKVEELTLYIIQMEKRLAELERK